MARMIDADELEMFPYSEVAGTEEQIADWIEQAGISEDDTASRARDLCWKVIDGFINVVKTQPTLTQPNEPLTLEELREMSGQPFWDDAGSVWWIVAHVDGNEIYTEEGAILDFYEEGEEDIYFRRPPEGEA